MRWGATRGWRSDRAAPVRSTRRAAGRMDHRRPDRAPRCAGRRAPVVLRSAAAGRRDAHAASGGSEAAAEVVEAKGDDMTSKEKATWRDPALGAARDLELRHGSLRCFEAGTGAPIVFVHGLLVNANLWRKVVRDSARLQLHHAGPAARLAHAADAAAADLSPYGLADLIADAIEALGLEDVTLVGNDTGGASPDRRHPAPGADRPPRADLLRLPRELPAGDVLLLRPGRRDPGCVQGAAWRRCASVAPPLRSPSAGSQARSTAKPRTPTSCPG